MRSQTSGLPYFIGFARFHTGVPAVQSWLTEENELKLLVAAGALVHWAKGENTSADVVTALMSLPGMSNYSYHLLRSWRAVCHALKKSLKAKYMPDIKPQKQDDSEETCAQSMSAHVAILYDIISAADGWDQLTYSFHRHLPQTFSVSSRLSFGDRALLCCELQSLLELHLASWPTQADAAKMSCLSYCKSINRCELHALKAALTSMESIDYPVVSSTCRLEGQVLNKHWPAAREFDHSALSLKNLAKVLPKLV